MVKFCGDTNSNIITFEINRYYDNVDLLTKTIKVIVKNDLGTFTEDTCNIQYNDVNLRFSWILSESVTYKSGKIQAAICFIGKENGKNYSLKTLPFSITIENSIDFSENDLPYKNWYIDIENEFFELKDIILNSNNPDTTFHIHENRDILDKLGLSDDGNLLYDGKEIVNSKQPLSAYDIAVKNGFDGTEAEWLDSLKGQQGDKGIDGKDGVSPDVEDITAQLKSDAEFVNSLKGDKGDPGENINLEILDSIESIMGNTVSGRLVDSLVIKEVFQSVSDGKALLASAITDKGVATDAGDTFSIMAVNIGKIEVGGGAGQDGKLKVQTVSFNNSSKGSTINIDIKQYSDNYQNLKYGENLFFQTTGIYFPSQTNISAGWKFYPDYINGNYSYIPSTGIFTIKTANMHGIRGTLYIVEIE